MAIAREANIRIIDLCSTQGLFQRLFNGIDALFTDLVGIDRLSDDGQQVVDIGLLLVAKGLSVFLQYAVSLLEVSLRHLSIPIFHLGSRPAVPKFNFYLAPRLRAGYRGNRFSLLIPNDGEPSTQGFFWALTRHFKE